MESDSKNKRGRPKAFHGIYSMMNDDGKCDRAALNNLYAGMFTQEVLKQQPGDFFWKESGYMRRQAIAEQLGRIYYGGVASKEECIQLAQDSIQAYRNGQTVKQIAERLKNWRIWQEVESRGNFDQ